MFPVNSGKCRVRLKIRERGELLSLSFNQKFLLCNCQEKFSQFRLCQTGQLFEIVSSLSLSLMASSSRMTVVLPFVLLLLDI
jgi:hypothetical protein